MFKLNKKKLFAIASGISVGSLIVWHTDKPIIPIGSPHDFPISKTVKFLNNKSDLQITLFQYQTCPFCCKVRTYLDYHGINYKIIEVNSVTQKQLKWSQYRKVPIALVENKNESIEINDSSVIISLLESYRLNNSVPLKELGACYPRLEYLDNRGKKKIDFLNKYQIMLRKSSDDVEKTKLELKWRQWVDDTFVHSLSPNIYRTPSEALSTFQHVAHSANWEANFGYLETMFIIYVGAFVMYFVGKMLRKRHNLKDDVRESLFEQAQIWVTELGGRRYVGGQQPNLSDLAMYGVLIAIEGCAAFDDLMHQNPLLKSWFYNMRDLVQVHRDKVAV